LPTMIATLMLLDPASGSLLAVMDATWLTELRTAESSISAFSMAGSKASSRSSLRTVASSSNKGGWIMAA